ncbi:hypothetical protein OHA72_21985 [Dactylosporangium sp. NBC_01737]|uniref:hypothetical protein n=1 Tax=Dactylosporangium sp. NBC_01737 TaxID=2975959 RepID=UPI002E0EA62E|nr:hypothetical protein OHA72_21985 [Dactylosporangium sp. NBC_01737]
MSFLQRYLRGEHEQVWADLRELGPSVRGEEVFEDAHGVAVETMRRVRSNVEAVRRRLDDAGYRFKEPDRVHVPPPADAGDQLDNFEQRHGPLPLSLRAFYEVVGTVDFRQSWEQLVGWNERKRRAVPTEPIEYLGEYDPLMVEPLNCKRAAWQADFGKRSWFLAPDECHKANYSGGDHYEVLLPDDSADFRIYGMVMSDQSPFGEHFVEYLRETFRGGGFRGTVEVREGRLAGRSLPDLDIASRLADGLQPLGVSNAQGRLFET